LSSHEEILSFPVSLLGPDILLDGGAVEEPIFADSFTELDRLLEDNSPLLDGCDVLVHALAISDSVWQIPDDLAEVLNGREQVQGLDVSESLLAVLCELIRVTHASTKLVKVIVSGEAVDKTGHEVRSSIERWQGVLRALNGANCERHQVGQIFSSLKVLLAVPGSLNFGDVTLNFCLVEHEMLGDGGSEFSRIGEDLSPCFDRINIICHALTGAQSLRDLQDSKTELQCTLQIIVHASLLDISDSEFDFLGHEGATVVAGLDLCEMVVSSHSKHEASCEICTGSHSSVK